MHHTIRNEVIRSHDLCAVDKGIVSANGNREIGSLSSLQLHSRFQLSTVAEEVWYGVVVEGGCKLGLRHAWCYRVKCIECFLSVGGEEGHVGSVENGVD